MSQIIFVLICNQIFNINCKSNKANIIHLRMSYRSSDVCLKNPKSTQFKNLQWRRKSEVKIDETMFNYSINKKNWCIAVVCYLYVKIVSPRFNKLFLFHRCLKFNNLFYS